MAIVDPFAGIGDPAQAQVQPGSLGGMDIEPSAPVEGSWLAPPEELPDASVSPDGFEPMSPEDAAALVVEGSLKGDDGAGEPLPTQEEELDTQLDSALEQDEPAPPIEQPPAELAADEDPGPLDMPRRRRGRPRTVTPADAPVLIRPDEWLMFAQGTLDNGEPFWYVVGEATGKTREAALRDAFSKRGEGVDEVTFFVARKDTWRPLTARVQTQTRTYTRMVVE